MLGLLVSSELVVQLLSEACACFSEELEEGQVQLGAFDGDTGLQKTNRYWLETYRAIFQDHSISVYRNSVNINYNMHSNSYFIANTQQLN